MSPTVSEQADDYPNIVVRIGNNVRVVECRDTVQWIIQAATNNRWRNLGFYRRRDPMVRDLASLTGDPRVMEVLNSLPEMLGPRVKEAAE